MTAGEDQPIEVMISDYIKGKMPKDATLEDWKLFNSSFIPYQTTARGLAQNVYRGYSFCPIFTGRRLKANFIKACHIALDFDTGDNRSTLPNLGSIDVIKQFASFVYTTPSHTEEHPKARVVWILQNPITDLVFYENLFKALLKKIPFADQGVKDGLRLYYGSPKCGVLPNWSLLPTEATQEIVKEYLENLPKRVEISRTVQISPDQASTNYLDRKREMLLGIVAGAREGDKHYTLARISFLFGGLVAAGYYKESEIKEYLEKVIDKMSGVKNKESAYQTIKDCMKDGMLKPVWIERAHNAGENINE